MSNHEATLEKTGVQSSLDKVKSLLADIKAIDNLPAQDDEHIRHVEYVVDNFEVSMSTADKMLISTNWLTSIKTALDTISQNLTYYKTQRNTAYVNQAAILLNMILENTAKINTVKSEKNLENFMSLVGKYQETVNDYFSETIERNKKLENEKDNLLSKITALESELQTKAKDFENQIDKQKTRLDDMITKHQDQIADNKSEFQDQIAENKKTFATQQGQFVNDFTKSQILRTNAFDNRQKEREERANGIVLKCAENIKQFKIDTEEVIAENKEIFDERQEEVKKIVGILNNNMFSHKYGEVANDAKKRGEKWHKITIYLMILLAATAFLLFIVGSSQNMSWISLVARIFTTTTIATGATYAARQASKQEKVERYARKIEMEMVSIDPFLESLGDPLKQEVKAEIARFIFCNPSSMEISSKDVSNTAISNKSKLDIANIIKEAVEKINA